MPRAAFIHGLPPQAGPVAPPNHRRPRHPPAGGSAGVTLVELLVVIAIIGVLVGLLLPAVQGSREAARRGQCLNNLRQIGVGLSSRVASDGTFPPARSSVGLSGLAFVLPHIEQMALYEKVDFTKPWDDAVHAPVRQARVTTFRCPSDPAAKLPPSLGGNNYRLSQGSGILWGNPPTSSSDPNFGMSAPDGVFLLDSRMRPSEVTDGLSNTAAASEHTIGDFDNTISSPPDTFWPQTTPQTADQAIQHCESIDPLNAVFQRVSDVGARWLYGYHSTTIYFHSQIPNRRSCMFPPGRIMTTAKSGHPGGVGLAMCDGSTRFVGDTIDLALWRSLGSRAGGETLR
jgi:prepilin-type N-terminal cleavage/methylation domain-containing protein